MKAKTNTAKKVNTAPRPKVKKGTLPFSDSKDAVMLPWTPDLEDTYKATYGESLVEKLPELFWELPDGKVSITRYHYHDPILEYRLLQQPIRCKPQCRIDNLIRPI